MSEQPMNLGLLKVEAERDGLRQALERAHESLGEIAKLLHDFDQEGAHDEWRFAHVERLVREARVDMAGPLGIQPSPTVCPKCGGHTVNCLIHGHRTSPEQP